MESVVCPGCSVAHSPARKGKRYCSRRCLSNYRARERAKVKGYPIKFRKREGHCLSCGLYFCQRSRTSCNTDAVAYCSRGCYNDKRSFISLEKQALGRIQANWKWRPNAVVVAEIAALKRIASYKERPLLTLKPCRRCGLPTIGRLGYKRVCLPCSVESKRASAMKSRKREGSKRAKRIYKAMRRAKERGVEADKIDPIQVFDADGWTCYLCGCDTPKAKRGTYEPDAPELDHVIALAQGGTHTYDNVRCCCRRCNGLKGATTPAGASKNEKLTPSLAAPTTFLR